MAPKDKAKELVCKMYGCTLDTDLNDIYRINEEGYFIAKDSALIAVDLMIEEVNHWLPRIIYLRKVKEEINKL